MRVCHNFNKKMTKTALVMVNREWRVCFLPVCRLIDAKVYMLKQCFKTAILWCFVDSCQIIVECSHVNI